MLRFLQGLFGRDATATPRRPGEERRKTPRTSAASVLAGQHPAVTPAPAPTEAPAPKPKKRSSTPKLSLEDNGSPAQDDDGDGGNPYDTGTFKRPDAWRRVTKADKQ